MTRTAAFVATVCLGLFANVCHAGKYNQVLDIGDAAPRWSELPGVDGKSHAFEQWEEKKVLVVVFTCNSCPYAVDAEDRLIALHHKYADQGVAVVAINVNKVEEDLLPAMKEKAKAKGFPFAYLFDESQQIARLYGAMVTPECYVLDSDRKVRYMGSIDDSPDGRKITVKYLENAIDAVLADQQPELSETVPIGCQVRYERSRSSRRRRQADGQ